MATQHTVTLDTPIVIKISVNGQLKKLKLPMKDLGVSVLPDKLRQVLDIKPEQHVLLERFSDSAGGYITLDESNPQVFKTLARAAKAKLKLRLKATVTPPNMPAELEDKKEAVKQGDSITTTPKASSLPRESTAVDRRSVGSGIFQFREARASQQTLVNEAPVPRPFTDDAQTFNLPSQTFALRPREVIQPAVVPGHSWSVYCNECDKPMANAHYHCSICDSGDFDLCEECVAENKHCRGEGHWLIKRFIKDGCVVASETERVSRKVAPLPVCIKSEPEMPGSFKTEESKVLAEVPAPTRTCNNCVVVHPESEFVTCIDCPDFDLCIKCHTADKHGHHPAHAFEAATAETVLPLAAETKLAAGRNVRHFAICDGCDKSIYGVRHKCLNCPDWDYCNDCVKSARTTHPRHRFAPLYLPIASPAQPTVRHFGIFCDGPLCSAKQNPSYIQGVRYKCTICHDTDFCAACEALPSNHHNRTHPLIKLKTPVRNVNVSTENEDNRGNVRLMGDRRVASPSESASANAAAPVQTVAEIMPTEVKKEETLPIPIPVKKFVEQVAAAPAATGTLLNAHFVQDTIRDGMKLSPETRFTQTWTLINPGPLPWPTGCSVRYVGGDNMLNVDNSHPASVAAIAEATESNVVGRAVFPGEKIGFTVSMKAPVREGKAISYWRLKAADGTPFGHRLWCDIEVVKPEEPSPAAAQIFIPELNMQAQMQAQNQTRAAQLQQQQRHAAQIQAQMQAQQQHQRTLWQAAADLPYAQVAPHYPQTVMQQHQQQHQVNGTVFNASSFTMSPPPKSSGPNFAASDEGAKLAARFSAMREQQKARREQMIAQMNAQREQQQRQAALGNDGVSYTHTSPTIQRTDETEAEKQRREALKQRVAHIKANILKTREEREQAEKAEKKAKDNEKVQNILAQLAKAEEKTEEKTDEKLSDSKMVFPKLDKESPASSTYESATSSTIKGKAKAAYVENENGEVERSAAPAAPALPELASPSVEENDGFVDLDDELEVFSADGDDSDEEGDGFMTDEEYDILDASDAETVASGWRG